MNTIAPHAVDATKLQSWRNDVERAHGTLTEYARETKSGLSAQAIEALAVRPVRRAAVAGSLEQIGRHFANGCGLQERLNELATSHALFTKHEQQMVGELMDTSYRPAPQDTAQVTYEAMLAEKFVRAWELMRSGNRAEQLVGTKFLADLTDNVTSAKRLTQAMEKRAMQLGEQQRSRIRGQVGKLYRSLYTAHGTLHPSIEEHIRTVHEFEFDTSNPALHGAYEKSVSALHRLMDDINVSRLNVEGLTMRSEHRDAIGTAFKRCCEAYGVHVYNMIADQLGYARFHRATMKNRNSSATNRLLLQAIEAKLGVSYSDFVREPSLAHWKTHAEATDRSIASSFLQNFITSLGSSAFVLDSTTKAFECQMQRIRSEQLRKSASVAPEPAQDVDRLMQELDLHDEPAAKVCKKNARKKPQKKTAITAPASPEAAPVHTADDIEILPAHIRRNITESLQHRRESRRFEGEAAEMIIENYSIFASVIGMNERIARRDRSELGEIDVHLDNAIVECTLMPGGEAKERQIEKLLTNKLINPFAKRVILYAPNYTKAAEQRLIKKHGSDLLVARTPDDLGLMLFVNWSDRAREQKLRSER